MTRIYPALATEIFAETRSGLHAFAKLLGAYTSACAPRRKHWWHISLKPVVDDFWTGVLQSNGLLFELVLNFHSLTVRLFIAGEDIHEYSIQGESVVSMKNKLATVLSRHSVVIALDEEKIESSRQEIDREYASRHCQLANVRTNLVCFGDNSSCFMRTSPAAI